MDGDFDIGYQFVGRRNQESDVDRVEDVGALVRLVREAEDFVDSFYQECTKRGSKDERDSAAWLSEARALLKNKD